MTPDQRFARWGRVAIVTFCALFIYFVLADYGQYLGSNQDFFYDALYRFSSMCVALVATLIMMAVLHRLLNLPPMTRAHAD